MSIILYTLQKTKQKKQKKAFIEENNHISTRYITVRSHQDPKANDPSVASFLTISRHLHVVISDCRKLQVWDWYNQDGWFKCLNEGTHKQSMAILKAYFRKETSLQNKQAKVTVSNK